MGLRPETEAFNEAFKIAEQLVPLPDNYKVKDLHPHTYLAEIIRHLQYDYQSITLKDLAERNSKWNKVIDALDKTISEADQFSKAKEKLSENERALLDFKIVRKDGEPDVDDVLQLMDAIKQKQETLALKKRQPFKLKGNAGTADATPHYIMELLAEFYVWHTGKEPTRKVYTDTSKEVAEGNAKSGKAHGGFKEFTEPLWLTIFQELGLKIPSFDSIHKAFQKAEYPESSFKEIVKKKFPN